MSEEQMDLGSMAILIDIDILLEKNLDVSILGNNLQEKSRECSSLSAGITYRGNTNNVNEPYKPLDAFSHLKNAYKALILVVPENIDELIDDYVKDPMEEDNPNVKTVTKYLTSSQLFNHTIGHCYIVWDKDQDVCGIWELCIHREKGLGLGSIFMETLLDTLTLNIPSTTLLWLIVSLNNSMFRSAVSLYTKYGFDNPFMYKNDPFTKNDWNTIGGGVQLTRRNEYIDPEDIQKEEARNEVYYIIYENINIRKNLSEKFCRINLKYNTSFGRWLSKLPKGNLTLNFDKTLTQKELGGIMTVDNIHQIQDTYAWELILDKDYETIIGTEDQVNIVEGRYTFHTHPINTILSRDLVLATPSAKDFSGFLHLALNKNAVFHSVITEEGIYILSLHPMWLTEQNFELLKKYPPYNEIVQGMEWNQMGFIQDKNVRTGDLVSRYLKKVEEQQQKILNGKPIFTVQFLYWSDIFLNKYFSVGYPTIHGECFPTERNILQFNKLYPANAVPI